MTMLTENEICDLRGEFDDLLGESCEIQRATTTSDGMGGSTDTWATVATVCCTVAPVSRTGRAERTGEQVREVQARMVTLPAETDVRLTDRLIVNGQTLEVVDLRESRTYEIVRRVEARIV